MPLTGRVGVWRGALGPFPAPASSNTACGFPALRFPVKLRIKGYVTYRASSAFESR